MTILILMPVATQRGGAEQLLRLFVEHVDQKAARVIVVFFETGPLCESFREVGIETQVIPTGRLRELSSLVRSIRKIGQCIRTYQPDIVFSWMPKAHFYGGWAANLNNVPSVWYQHGTPQLGWMDQLITLIPASRIITCSHFVARMQGNLWPERPITVIHPAVDVHDFAPEMLPSPSESRRLLDLPEDGVLIGLVGRLQRWKGIHVLLDAMPSVLEQHPSAHAVVVGGQHDLEPDYPAFLHRRINALGLSETVHLVGYQSNIPLWMQAMDIIVHASDREPFGMVIIEAMALGKPVVAGSEGGPSDIITPGTNGLLAPFEDADTLSDRILYYLDHPQHRAKIGTAARRRARDFSARRFTQRLLTTLRSIATSTESTQVPAR